MIDDHENKTIYDFDSELLRKNCSRKMEAENQKAFSGSVYYLQPYHWDNKDLYFIAFEDASMILYDVKQEVLIQWHKRERLPEESGAFFAIDSRPVIDEGGVEARHFLLSEPDVLYMLYYDPTRQEFTGQHCTAVAWGPENFLFESKNIREAVRFAVGYSYGVVEVYSARYDVDMENFTCALLYVSQFNRDPIVHLGWNGRRDMLFATTEVGTQNGKVIHFEDIRLPTKMNSNFIQPGDNPDIVKERRAAEFDIQELSTFIHGSSEVLKRRREILEFVESRAEFRDPIPIEFMSREQRYEEQARKAVAMTELATDAIDGSDFFGEGMYYQTLIMGRDLHAMSLHYVMFLPTIQNQTNEEQMDKWLGLVITRGILGTYAQTELGHGTNLSRLETTSTYDPKTEEFVLHSPTITAAFVSETLAQSLELTAAIMAFFYVKPKHSKLGYGSMIFVRSIMIRDQAMQLGAALKVSEQLGAGNVELLPELHALSSGLKSVVSWEVAQGIEQCRLSCGGHGYSQASGFPEIYAYAVGGVTYEGENIVMLLQVARQLVKRAEDIKNGNTKLAEIESYLLQKSSARSSFRDHSTDPSVIVADFEHVARQQIFYVAHLYEQLKSHATVETAWNKCSVELCRASRLHVKTYLIRNFFAHVSRFQGSSKVREILLDLGRLYALDQITHAQHQFIKDGYYNESQAEAARLGIYELLALLRPNVVGIVDSFDFSDRELHSVLGRRDGNVYPALLEWAQQSQLNKEDVLPAYTKYLGPMMKEGRSKL
ncbi:Acyl-CoA oxidase dehydrogenase and Acyl-CoA oxidase domain containing protein [Aphelenchoides besseyi]|nr:Acyl-CoA oxidase dehydrogenase and Acyl-CoA oxidase domain containing protein [Aphelenchoides besseyi]